MVSLVTLIILTAMMSAVQIGIWSVFPKYIKDLIMSNTILAFVINLVGSCMILSFTGSAMLVGSANLGASIVFAFYCALYKKQRGITGMEWKVCKIFKYIPVFVYLRAKIVPTDFKVFSIKSIIKELRLMARGVLNHV